MGFGDTEIGKLYNWQLLLLRKFKFDRWLEFNKIMLSNMVAFGKKNFKYLIGYIYWHLIGCTKCFNEIKKFLR